MHEYRFRQFSEFVFKIRPMKMRVAVYGGGVRRFERMHLPGRSFMKIMNKNVASSDYFLNKYTVKLLSPWFIFYPLN